MNLTGIRFPQRVYQSDQEAPIDMNEYICEMLNYLKDTSLLRTLGLHLLYGLAKNRKLEIAVAL